jgi:hypothetical protein
VQEKVKVFFNPPSAPLEYQVSCPLHINLFEALLLHGIEKRRVLCLNMPVKLMIQRNSGLRQFNNG